MSQLEINNFGPISKLKINVQKKVNFVIGPQASGKSTIGKVLFFCKKIRDYYVDYILQDGFFRTHPNELYINYLKYVRKNFMGCFGTTKHMLPFTIKYTYPNNEMITITLRDGYAFFEFTESLGSRIKDSFLEAYNVYKNNLIQEGWSYFENFNARLQLKNEIKSHFTELSSKIFGFDEEIIYIPAGRSLLSVLSDQVDSIDISILDLSMREFIERIRITRSRFGSKLDSIVADYLKTVQGSIKNADIGIAQELIKHILKADYVNDSDGEKLYFSDERWVKLIYGSSGQQESLWILLLLFITILENKRSYIILEEPEAHLYPISQKYIVELIALTINSSDSKFFITTHSPYILSSANLLIQSAMVESRLAGKNEEVIVRKQLRMLPQGVGAYKIEETDYFKIKNIIDKKVGLIQSIEIDTISNQINEASEKLDELEIKYDM